MSPTTMIAAGLIALAGAPAVRAQAPEVYPFDVVANAPQVCALGQPAVSLGQIVNFTGLDGSALGIHTLADPTTLAVQAARVTVGFDGICNYPHRLVLQSQEGGLWRDALTGSAPDGFAEAVPYVATLTWGSAVARFNADASTRSHRELSIAVGHPTAGTLAIELDIAPGASNLRRGSPLLAGTYQDTLRITVEPQ